MFHELVAKVIAELDTALYAVNENDVTNLVRKVLEAQRIVVHGAGRVGLACKGFAMRLGHVGRRAFAASDSTLPPIGKGDLLILASSSGETQTVFDVGVEGKRHGAHIIVITAQAGSRMATLADSVLILKTPTKFGPLPGTDSIQPMATLFEQSLQLLFDIIILILMEETNQAHADLWARHANLD